jgi:hypothetical protein
MIGFLRLNYYHTNRFSFLITLITRQFQQEIKYMAFDWRGVSD